MSLTLLPTLTPTSQPSSRNEMDNQKSYLEQCMPDRVVVLGQPLNPFSLGHLKILIHHDNKFVIGGTPTLTDLIFGVWVCCQTYEEVMAGLLDSGMERKIHRWGKRMRKADLGIALKTFAEYIAKASERPEVDRSDFSRTSGTPTIQHIQIILQGKLNHSLSEALNKPWGEAVWDYYAYAEMNGATKVFGPDEEQLFSLAMEARKGLN